MLYNGNGFLIKTEPCKRTNDKKKIVENKKSTNKTRNYSIYIYITYEWTFFNENNNNKIKHKKIETKKF